MASGGSHVDVTFRVVDARSPEAVAAMSAYFVELDTVFEGGFDPGDTLSADAASFDPPHGVFVLVAVGGDLAGCGGVHSLDDDICEIKRMWIDRAHRGRGIASLLLRELEERARSIGASTVRLDTNASLDRAIAMYEGAGYRSIARYNDNPYAQRWFEKQLA